ncbi:MAG: hypothetical protein HC802_17270, partial [Caldilineaceae bacterium]|nr:hypothetical protein [Caldilineaceae bacterium]
MGEFGQTFQDAIDKAAVVKSYSFVANGGDTLSLRVLGTSGLLRPRARVISRLGIQVCNASNGDPVITISGCALETAGGYLILLDDTFSEKTGDFSLFVQRPNLPGSAIFIDSFDQTKNGTIDTSALGGTYKFLANQNDVAQVRATRTSGQLNPQLRIVNRHGSQVCFANSSGGSTAQINGCILEVAGTHYILIEDESGARLGNYELYLTCTNENCDKEPPPPPPPPPP